jgi:hypothetical protein
VRDVEEDGSAHFPAGEPGRDRGAGRTPYEDFFSDSEDVCAIRLRLWVLPTMCECQCS